jgi:hypothetical protein
VTHSKKTWIRATQITGEFPENKYSFSQHLKERGDYVITGPISKQDFNRLKWAAHHWAYHHECRIKMKCHRQLDGMCKGQVTLVDLNRIRDYK